VIDPLGVFGSDAVKVRHVALRGPLPDGSLWQDAAKTGRPTRPSNAHGSGHWLARGPSAGGALKSPLFTSTMKKGGHASGLLLPLLKVLAGCRSLSLNTDPQWSAADRWQSAVDSCEGRASRK